MVCVVVSRLGVRDMSLWRWWILFVASVLAAAGCSTPGTTLESTPEIVVKSVGAVLHDPVWSYRFGSLVGLTDDNRLAEITVPTDLGHTATRLSAPVAVGRNLQISRKDDRHVFVPEPRRGKVAV